MSSLLIQIVVAAGIFLAGGALGIKWHAGQDAIKEVARQENQRAIERIAEDADVRPERRVDPLPVGRRRFRGVGVLAMASSRRLAAMRPTCG